MGWPTVPQQFVANDQVTIQRAGQWTQDRSGGKVRTLGPASPPYGCTIKPYGRAQRADQMGNLQDVMVAIYQVTFSNTDPGLFIHDQLNWLYENKILTVVSTDTGGTPDARQWIAYCEHRPAL